jgi:hypothetical protein
MTVPAGFTALLYVGSRSSFLQPLNSLIVALGSKMLVPLNGLGGPGVQSADPDGHSWDLFGRR